jgi:hypothetical protein
VAQNRVNLGVVHIRLQLLCCLNFKCADCRQCNASRRYIESAKVVLDGVVLGGVNEWVHTDVEYGDEQRDIVDLIHEARPVINDVYHNCDVTRQPADDKRCRDNDHCFHGVHFDRAAPACRWPLPAGC